LGILTRNLLYQSSAAAKDKYPALKNVSHIHSSLFAVSSPSALLYPNPISPIVDKMINDEISIQCVNCPKI
jgi:hypothetical protein